MSDEPTDEQRTAATEAWWERMALAGHSFEEGRTVLQHGRWVTPEEVDMGRPWWTLGSETHPSTYVEPSPLPEGWEEVGYTAEDHASAFAYRRHTETPVTDAPGATFPLQPWQREHLETILAGGRYPTPTETWLAARRNGKRHAQESAAALAAMLERKGADPALRFTPETEAQLQAIGSPFRHLGTMLEEVVAALGAWADDFWHALQRAGVVEEPPPTDPREHALWMRKHRNTGPAKPPPGARQNRR